MNKIKFLILILMVTLLSSCSLEEPGALGSSQDNPVFISGNTSGGAAEEHAINHQNDGSDEISVNGLSGLLADDQHVLDTETISAIENAAGISGFTMDDVINMGTQKLEHIGGILADTGGGYLAFQAVTNSFLDFYGGTLVAGEGARVQLFGFDHATHPGSFRITTPNSAGTVDVERLKIYGNMNTSVADWSGIYHQGIAMSSYLDMTDEYIYFTERAAPGAGAANTARIYALQGASDNLTDMCAVFQDGTVDVFAQESTELDAPIFIYPSGTVGSLELIKEHAGLVKICMVFPSGEEFVIRQIEYHDADKIAANKGCLNPLPEGWEITTADERALKNVPVSDNITG